MNYQEAIDQLFKINLFNPKQPNLDNCRLLDKIFDTPHTSFQTIHIAGTNGKGSVATKIAKTLQLSGYKVALFTSPHLYSFCERIQINGVKISETEVANYLTLLFNIIEQHQIAATFFEITTYLAYLYFKQEKVDYVVLETGLGGRLDATNLVYPLLSIITSISLDHTEILGQTIEEITLEKAGIIKFQIPVIIGPHVSLQIIRDYAKQIASPCIQVHQSSQTFQEENRAIAHEALKYLSKFITIPEAALRRGLSAQPPCRFEIISLNPNIVLDVAHNPTGLTELFKSFRVHFPQKKMRILFALSKSKDILHCLEVLKNQNTYLYPVEAANGRCLAIASICHYLNQLEVDSQLVLRYPTLAESVMHAKNQSELNDEVLVICGSFYIMDEVQTILKKMNG